MLLHTSCLCITFFLTWNPLVSHPSFLSFTALIPPDQCLPELLVQISTKSCLPEIFLIELTLIFRRRRWHPTPVLLPGKSHGRRSLMGCSPWDREELDTTGRLHFHFSLSCIGEGNGNPLQCSCLENPRDGGVWWAAVYGVTQSWTQLKWLSSSSSSTLIFEKDETLLSSPS